MQQTTTLLSIILLIFCSCKNTPCDTNIAQANLELTSRYFTEVYNLHKTELIDTLFTENYEHTSTEGRKLYNRQALKLAVKRIEGLLPNLKLTIEEAAADKDKVMFLIRMESDLPAMANPNTTSKQTDFNETFIFWVKNGKIYKGRSVGAHLPLIKQVSGFEGGLLDIIQRLSD